MKESIPIEKEVKKLSKLALVIEKIKTFIQKKKDARDQGEVESSSLPVRKITLRTFEQLLAKLEAQSAPEIESNWKRFSDRESIINTGAGPCTIIYVHDLTNGEVISAHYPITTIKDRAKHLQNRMNSMRERLADEDSTALVIPTDKQRQLLDESERQ